MKKVAILILTLIIFILIPLISSAIEERDLPFETAPPIPESERIEEPSIIFEGYANSRDVTIIGGVMSCVYYFCKKVEPDFCSDMEGVLVVTGAETGKIPEIIKALDVALSDQNKIMIKLSQSKYISGVRRIIDVKSSNSSI